MSSLTSGDGWTCAKCGRFVYWNEYHECQMWNSELELVEDTTLKEIKKLLEEILEELRKVRLNR